MKRNETHTTYEFKREEHDPKVKIKIWNNFVVLNPQNFRRQEIGYFSCIYAYNFLKCNFYELYLTIFTISVTKTEKYNCLRISDF